MADPRSKPKVPKGKQSKAPHVLQAEAKVSAMKATQSAVQPQVTKKAGRGR